MTTIKYKPGPGFPEANDNTLCPARALTGHTTGAACAAPPGPPALLNHQPGYSALSPAAVAPGVSLPVGLC